jgi:hypothetical protein
MIYLHEQFDEIWLLGLDELERPSSTHVQSLIETEMSISIKEKKKKGFSKYILGSC